MLDLLVIAAALSAALALGLRGARGARSEELEEYVLAGRGLTLPLFVSTLVPSFYGGVLGIGEFTWQNGVSNWVVMAFPYYVFAALYAWFLAGRVRLEPGLTLPDHIEGAYGRAAAGWAALLVFLLASPADELLMLGTLFSHLTGAELLWSLTGAAGAAAALLARGGLRSDVLANRLQIVLMYAGFALILPFAFSRLGGLQALKSALPAGHWDPWGGMSPWQLAGWWLIAVWTVVDPSFHQRCAAAKDPATARRGILVSIAFWAAFDAMTTTAGLYARAALPKLDNPLLAYPALADRLLPPFARGVFLAALACSILAALQAQFLLSATSLGKDALGRLMGAGPAEQKTWIQRSLFVTAGFSVALAWAIPSVVGLWWAIGSVLIPGLLLPLLGVYFPGLRCRPVWMLGSSISGVAVSFAWLVAERLLGEPPLGMAPMFPGLALSAALWGASRFFP